MFDKLKSWAEGEYAAVKGAVSAEVSEFIAWAEGSRPWKTPRSCWSSTATP